jgi:RNA polymerase sigma factor (sigma-70 family)
VSDSHALAGRLFERHGRSVRQYLRALTGRSDLADDLAQDVFVRVVQSAGSYEPRERERAWLFRIARNAAIDHHRRAAARPQTAGETREPTIAPVQQLRRALAEALGRLPDAEREAFLLAELGGLSYAEIAAALDLTPPAVRSALYRARLSLRAALTPPSPVGSATARTGHDDDD